MSEIVKQYIQKISPDCRGEDGENNFYAFFRIVVGLMFFLHGAQKLFGLMGGMDGNGLSAMFATLPWFAGLIEVVVGIFIFLGIFVRIAASLAAIEMAVAYLTVHLQMGINPLSNGGELAFMYLVSFLLIFYYGAGRWSLEKSLNKTEFF